MFIRALLALAPVFVTWLVQLMVWPFIQPYVWFLFVPAMFFSAWVGGRWLGLLASAFATLLIWYSFLPLERSFLLERPGRDLVAALVFLGTGVVFSIFHDRLKRAERKGAEVLAASRYQMQLESVFQAIQDGIVVTDMKGTFLLVNEGEARMHGFPSAEAMIGAFRHFSRPLRAQRPGSENTAVRGMADQQGSQGQSSHERGIARTSPGYRAGVDLQLQWTTRTRRARKTGPSGGGHPRYHGAQTRRGVVTHERGPLQGDF
jgi:PAS domain-containing protein